MIKKILFKIQFFLMPAEFKSGSWIVMDGDFTRIDGLWKKGKKKNTWFILRIEWVEKKTK